MRELKGIVSFFNARKFIGMIHGEDNKAYYFRKGDSEERLEEGDKVVFKEREALIPTQNKIFFAHNIRRTADGQ